MSLQIYNFFSQQDQPVHDVGMNMRLTRSRSILPALAFSLDMFQKTGSNYGVNEVLLASVLGAVVFSLFSAQPLVIVGVTGKLSSRLELLILTIPRPNYRL